MKDRFLFQLSLIMLAAFVFARLANPDIWLLIAFGAALPLLLLSTKPKLNNILVVLLLFIVSVIYFFPQEKPQSKLPFEYNAINTITGTICREPETGKNYTRYTLGDVAIGEQKIEKLLLVDVFGKPGAYGRGDIIRFSGEIGFAAENRNMSRFSYSNYLSENNILGICRTGSGQIELLERGRLNVFEAVPGIIRSFLSVPLEDLGAGSAAFLRGIMLGDISEIDRDIYKDMKETGMVHILAISGMHMGIIALIAIFLCRSAGLRGGLSISVVLMMLLLYIYLTGFRDSAIRAGIMIAYYLLGRAMSKKIAKENAIGFALILIMLINPESLLRVGYQLSFLAVFFIFAGVEASLKASGYIGSISGNWPAKYKKPLQIFCSMLVVSTFVTVGTAPAILYHFGKVSLSGIILNLAAVPLTGILMPAGFLYILLYYTVSGLAAAAGEFLEAGINIIFLLARFGAGFRALQFSMPVIEPWVIVAIYGAGMLLLKRMWKSIAVVGIIVVVAWVFYGESSAAKVHIANIESENLLIIEGRDGTAGLLLNSVGQSIAGDIKYEIMPILNYLGISRLDFVAADELYIDIINNIMEECEIGDVYLRYNPAPGLGRQQAVNYLQGKEKLSYVKDRVEIDKNIKLEFVGNDILFSIEGRRFYICAKDCELIRCNNPDVLITGGGNIDTGKFEEIPYIISRDSIPANYINPDSVGQITFTIKKDELLSSYWLSR